MGSSIFKSIRKSYSVHFLLTSVMTNLMVIGEPAMAMISNHYASKNKIVSYSSSVYSGGINPILSNDIVADNSEEHLGKVSTVNGLNIPNDFIEATIYYADQKLGVIGRASEVEVENPYDNVFKVNLPEVNFNEYEAVLQYELYGVLNAAQTTKSINNNEAYGGELIIKNNEWTRVNEVLPSVQLTSGINEIFFNRREDAYYSYKVKNLSVQIIKKAKQKLNIVTQDLDSYNQTMYVVGLVNDPAIVKVKVLDQEIDVINGVFEGLISGVQNNLEQIEVTLVDKNNNQEVYKKSISHKAATVDFILNDLNSKTTALFDYENLDQGCVYYQSLSYTPKDFTPLNEKSKVLIEGLPFKDVRSISEDVDNVTAGDYYGYRVKHFNLSNESQAEIRLKYDLDKIPSGYGPKDVKTFFYDRTQNSWKALPVDEIDYENQEIVSTLPANETDYINGVIKVPESPETASFAPTTITDMKYADPSAGIVSIAPPTANNTGAATTSFPIKLPAGRNGMQPNLAVNYNSEGGNGWMGIGWNISTPAITLNTKWGAPRFDTTKETELYSLNGADLVFEVGGIYTSPHREESISRNFTGNRVFYERKEGSYNKIIRHGNSPANYWWEVIDKQGNKIYYGWNPTANEIVENSVMRSPNSNPNTNGNIAHWGITYMVDLYGNYIKYNYEKMYNNEVFGSAVPAQEQYLQSIEYTLKTNENLLHYYKVEFERNNYSVGTSGTITRNDKIVTARNGYVQVIDDLLTQIKVSYKNNNSTERIRTYRFNYEIESSFRKSLLKEISEYDAGGNLFYTNKLEYYKGSENTLNENSLFSTSNTLWSAPSDNNIIDSNFNFPPFSSPKGSIIGSSITTGSSVGFRGGIGIGFNFMKPSTTIGGSYNYSGSAQNTKITFIDINGDGLPDKVFEKDGKLFYRPNLGFISTNQGGFGDALEIQAQQVDNLSFTKSTTNGFGADFNVGGFGLGKSWSRTKSNTDSYFSDINGDGLPDIISGSRVHFNVSSSTDNISRKFLNNNVASTENIISAGIVDETLVPFLNLPTIKELRADFPQFDHVKIWRATYSGKISISGQAKLLESNPLPSGQSNLFRISIEKANSVTSGAALVLPTSYTNTNYELKKNVNESLNMNYSNLTVEKGDYILFRIHNKGFGSGGKVEWNPKIVYTQINNTQLNTLSLNTVDENSRKLKEFDSKDDFFLNSGNGVTVGAGGIVSNVNFNLNLNVNTIFAQYAFSDEITFALKRLRLNISTGVQNPPIDVARYKYKPKEQNSILRIVNELSFSGSQQTPSDIQDTYYFVAESDSNVDWKTINWLPSLQVTEGVNTTTHYPGVTYQLYDENVNQTKYWADINNNTIISPQIDPLIPGDSNEDYIKISHNMFSQNYSSNWLYQVYGGEINPTPLKINWVIKSAANGIVKTIKKVTFYSHRVYGGSLIGYQLQFRSGISPTSNLVDNDLSYYEFKLNKQEVNNLLATEGTKIYVAFYIENSRFGNGNGASIGFNYCSNNNLILNIASPFMSKVTDFHGIPYKSWGQFLYNGGIRLERNEDGDYIRDSNDNNIEIISYGDNPIDMTVFDYESQSSQVDEDPDNVDINGIDPVVRYSFYNQDVQHNKFINNSIDYADSNEVGSYAEYGVEVVQATETITSKIGRFGVGNIYNIYISPQDIISGGPGVFVGLKQQSESKGSAVSLNAEIGSVTDSESVSNVLNQYIDLNGDRYPDIVTSGKIQYTNLLGALSYGESNDGFISGDKNKDRTFGITIPAMKPNSTGTNGGKNKTNTNISSGLNTSSGESYDSRQWVDMNGDGLPDKVIIKGDRVEVCLNLGYSFVSEDNAIAWGSGYQINKTSTRNNLSLSPSFGYLDVFSAGFGVANSTSNINATLIDVNGDGLPDLVIANGSTYRYYLNTGNNFENTSKIFYNQNIEQDYTISGNLFGSGTYGFSFTLFVPPIPFKVTFSPSVGMNKSYNEKGITVQDIDGDGLVDIITRDNNNNSNANVRLNQIQKTHLLKKVITPLGGSWTIDYAREGNTYDLPQSKWVLSKVITHDGFTGDETYRPNEHITTFEYENPKYDRREREFLGFEKVKTLQYLNFSNTPTTPYRTSVVTYHNSNYYLSGLQQLSQVFNQNNELLTEEKIYYNLLNPTNPQVNIEQALFNEKGVYNPYTNNVLDKSRIFVAPVMMVSKSFEGSQFIAAEKKFLEYDGAGNLKAYYDKGDGGNDVYFTRIKYYTEQQMGITNALGYAKEITVHQNNEQGPLMRKRNAEYNSQGKLSKVSVTLTADNDVNEVGFDYDNYGNLNRVNQYNNLSIINSGYYSVTVNYDNVVHTYPIETQNSFGETSTAQYNYWFGIPILTTDKNMKNMRTRIDTRGRIVEVTGPNEYPNGWTIRMDYKGQNINYGNPIPQNPNVFQANGSFNAPSGATPPNYSSYAVTRHFDPHISSNQFLTVSIVDGFGQPIQLKKTHVNGTSVGWLLNSFDKQDGLGRSIKTYLPKFETTGYPTNLNNIPSTGLGYVGGSPGQLLTETTYDERDRPITIKQVGESEDTTISYAIENGMFVQEVQNELNQRSKVYTDVRGRQRKTIQFYGNDEIETNFRYNSINEKVKVINHFGYVTEYKYDLAGRRIEELSPDRGVTQFKYDNAGNMISKITSNLMASGSEIQYSYDFGRLVRVVYPQNPQNNVTYKYGQEGDNLAIQKNAVGRLFMQEDATGLQLFAYGNMGELTTQVRSIAVAGYYRYWFLTQWEYDSWNRVKRIDYPDGERVNYNYNQAGMLKSVHASLPGNAATPIVSNIVYDEFGERRSIKYGNGTETRYEYDSRRRMQNLDYTFNTGNNSNYTIKKEYEYDAVSNITGIKTNYQNEQNLLNTISANGLIGGVIKHNYEYDDLNRLKHANGTYVGANDFPGAPYLKHEYELNMRYNHDHTILSKTQTHVQGIVSSYNGSMNNTVVMPQTNYHLEYSGYATGAEIIGNNYYGVQQPHAPREIVEYHDDQSDLDDPRTRIKKINYDTNGNQLTISEQYGDEITPLRVNLWDEENRLKGVDLKPSESSRPVAVYTYDANGERIIRYNYDNIDVASNSSHLGRASRDNVMIYPNGLIMAKPHILNSPGHTQDKSILSYTKHYYIGSERVGAKTGSSEGVGYFLNSYLQSNFSGINISNLDSSTENIQNNAKDVILAIHESFGIDQDNHPVIQNYGSYGNITADFTHNMIGNISQFYFHPDHLGSSSYITNQSGIVTQHMEYLPFGELMVDEHTNSYNSPFKYNGKEFDEETGNYFYGARYYDPKLSIFISVDPLAEKLPFASPYAFALNNPIVFIDPDGRYPIYFMTRSYAPFSNFGPSDNWYGDSRGHTLDINASSRSSALISYDTESRKTRAMGFSSRSHTVDGRKDAISPTSVYDRSVGNNIDVHSKGRNNAQKFSQPIDQFTKLTVTTEGNIKGNHILSIKGTISGDNFPNQESIVYDSSGNALWLGNFETKGDRNQAPVWNLPFENESDVHINIDIRIKVDKDGVFQGVMQKGQDGKEKMISIDNWNKKFKSDDNK